MFKVFLEQAAEIPAFFWNVQDNISIILSESETGAEQLLLEQM